LPPGSTSATWRRVTSSSGPISYQPRTRLAGKKISWSDGVAALVHLVRFNLLTDLDGAFRDLPLRYRP
jgi:hypothetical protein